MHMYELGQLDVWSGWKNTWIKWY